MRSAATSRKTPPQVSAFDEAAFQRFGAVSNVDLVLALEESGAEEAGQPSGAELRFADGGDYAHLVVYAGSYPLGAVTGPQLRAFLRELLATAEYNGKHGAAIPLLTMHPRIENRASGFELRCEGAYPVLSVTTADGMHSFGIAHGEALKRFLHAAVERAEAGLVDASGAGKVVSIMEGRRFHRSAAAI